MLKKIFSAMLGFLLVFVLIGCQPTEVALPDLTGKSRAQITETLEGLNLSIKYYFDLSVIYDEESDYDKFVRYGKDENSVQLAVGDIVATKTEIKVYTTPLNITINYLYSLSDALSLHESDYTGKEFIADGIGEVTISKLVDGDTTFFQSDGQSYSVRYLGIDTPESTALYQAWGKAAATYTAEKLQSAEKIVLEAEGDRQDGNDRYLAWVWYLPEGGDKFLLLNLELVELAYSKNKVSTGSVYSDVLTLADWNASATKRRVWGEIDPNYDYSKEGTQMTIAFLMENFADYMGLKVAISGIVTAKIGNSVYLQDESGAGIYMYAGYTSSSQLQIGAHVAIDGLTPTVYSGSPQLTNFNRLNLSLVTESLIITPEVITYDDFIFTNIGKYVTMNQLTVTGVNTARTSIYVTDIEDHEFVIRIDDSTGFDADDLGVTVGQVLTVTGPLGYYDYDYNNVFEGYNHAPSKFQLMLTASDNIIIE
ncbi:MAG: thermonuclease family protein [Candidatus Izemoplasmatales bacterium]|jgi:micrococcal nuclease|nr:thermonuclease family protein [Candidatus Izemoplasmatales bacterium]